MLIRYRHWPAVLALALLCLSCAPTVMVKYSPRPSAEAGAKRRIAFVQAAGTSAAKLQRAGQKLEICLINHFTQTPGFVVVERREIDAVLRESAFSLQAVVDERSACKAGRLLAADAIVLLKLSAVQVSTQRHELHQYLDGHASANAKMIDVETGQILASAPGEAYVSVLNRYSTPAEAEDLLVRKLAQHIAESLRPESAGRTLTLETSPNPDVRAGVRFAQEGLWEEAVAAWQELLSKRPDHAVAHYNLGIVKAAMGDAAAGRKHLERAVEVQPSKRLYLRALAAAKQARSEQ